MGSAVLVKLVAGVKELVVAYHFGTSDALDAFLIAFLLLSFAIELVSGSLNAAFIPTYIQVREHEGHDAAQHLSSTIMLSGAVLLIAVSIIFALIAPYALPIVASGFSPEKLSLTTSIYYMLLPCLVLTGLSTTWSAILNSQDRFALVAVTPMLTSVVTLLVLLVLARPWGVYALTAGTVGGSLLEAGVLGWWLRRRGFSLIPHRRHLLTPAVKRVWKQYTPMLVGSFLLGSASFVGQSMAAMLGPGRVSALSYGSKITTLILGIGALSVSTAVFPQFSRMVAVGDWTGVRHTLIVYARLIVLITLPLTLLLIYFSEPLVHVLFQRGAFTEADTQLVTWVQDLYLLQIPVFVLSMLAVRLISALQANRILMWGAAISLAVNIVFNYLLMKWLDVAGIALSTSLMYLVSTGFLVFMVFQLINRQRNG